MPDRDLAAPLLRRHIAALTELARIAGLAIPLDAFLQRAAEEVGRAIEINFVKVLRYRPGRGDLFVQAGVGWRPGVVRHATFPVDLGSPPGRAYQTGQPVVIHELEAAKDEFHYAPSLAEHGIASLLNVPILVDGAAWGVLEVDSETVREFRQDTVNFLLAAGEVMGAALRRARQEEERAQAAQEAARAGEAAQTQLREMQHRVKNNFQIILSMIALQKSAAADPALRRVLDDLGAKIVAMSMAHDQLSAHQLQTRLDLGAYLQTLTANIDQTLDAVSVEAQADQLQAPVQVAVALGLIANELITNAVKHAFGADGGAIKVLLETGVARGQARLTVRDNGRGLNEARTEGSGLRLIQALALQIGGRVEVDGSAGGTTTMVTFPMPLGE